MLVLGFCPLRNVISTRLFKPASAAPKTNGAHLLTADDICKAQFTGKFTAGQQHTLLPPLALIVLTYICGLGLYQLNRIACQAIFLQQKTVAIPIYLRNRTWRI